MNRSPTTWCFACLSLVFLPLCSNAESAKTSRGFELRSDNKVLVVRAQTAAEAYTHVLGLLRDMDFFQANGYDVALPDHPAFQQEVDSPGSAETFASEVYLETAYEPGLEAIAEGRAILQRALDWFAANSAHEGFRSFDRYEVTLTLYGPGGSYDPETGTIVLLTTPDGRFKGGGGPHTIVHEMMHLAIEEGLVQRFGLSHWEKERLVDLLVQRKFSDSLPDYQLQSLGEESLNPYVAEVPLAQITSALRRYSSDKQKN